MADPAGAEREPDVRFSLANERTFLAWARTCMAMVATGLVLTRLLADGDDVLTVAAGIVLILVAAGLAFWSYRNYLRNDRAIRTSAPLERSALPLVLILTIGTAAVGAIILSLG